MRNLGHQNETKAYIKSVDEIDEGCKLIASILNKSSTCELYIGVDNSGKIIGIQSFSNQIAQSIFERIQKNISPIIYPSIWFDNKDNIIKVTAFAAQRPYIFKKDYYIRSYDADREMDYDSLMNEIKFNNPDTFYEDSKTSDSLREASEQTIKGIYANSKVKFSSIRNSLKKMNLVKDGSLNLAGRYLFSKRSPLDIQINVYSDEQKKNIIKTTLIKGNIFELLEKALTEIESEQLKNITSKKINKDLLDETLTFAFLNTSFSKKEPFIIHISPYEISFKFPGTLFFLDSLDEYFEGNYKIQNRNKLIGRVFNVAGRTNSSEKSLRKIEKLCKDNSIIYSGITSNNALIISYYRYAQKKKAVTLEQAILSILTTRPTIKADLLAKKLNKTRRTIQTAIKKLKESNLIIRKGSNKNGYWIVNK